MFELHVSQETILSDESPAALFARTWHLLCVDKEMELEGGLDGESFLTDGTLVSPHSSMDQAVSGQIFLPYKCLLAFFTSPWAFVEMFELVVHFKSRFSVESLIAFVARETIFTCMVEYVCSELGRLDE